MKQRVRRSSGPGKLVKMTMSINLAAAASPGMFAEMAIWNDTGMAPCVGYTLFCYTHAAARLRLVRAFGRLG